MDPPRTEDGQLKDCWGDGAVISKLGGGFWYQLVVDNNFEMPNSLIQERPGSAIGLKWAALAHAKISIIF